MPSSVAVGPDGALYVGLLRGIPSDPGTAGIYRVVPGHQPEIWAQGLRSVTGIAFDRQGSLLATEFNTGGLLAPPTVPWALVRVSNNGRTVTTLPVPGLYQPTGVAVNADGTVYVSNYGDSTTSSSHLARLSRSPDCPDHAKPRDQVIAGLGVRPAASSRSSLARCTAAERSRTRSLA